MAVALYPDDERMDIRIGGPLTVAEAAEARDQIALGLATAPGPVEINLSEITEIDTAGLQLLLALAAMPGEVTLAEPSAEVAERIDRLGLREKLHLGESGDGS
jgi:anti-anti-sigma regulatory factor